MLIAALSLFVRVFSLIKDQVVAARFVVSDHLDPFFVAVIVPSFLVGALGESLGYSFLPRFVYLKAKESQEAARNLLGNALAINLALIIAAAGTLLLTAHSLMGLLARGFPEPKL